MNQCEKRGKTGQSVQKGFRFTQLVYMSVLCSMVPEN